MADNALTCEAILGNYGNPDHLKLDNIIDPPDPDEEVIHIMRSSHYFSIEKLPIHLQTVGNFNILSLNTQSINAKFDVFVAFSEIAKQQNVHFHMQSVFKKHGLAKIPTYRCYNWMVSHVSRKANNAVHTVVL